MSFSRLYRNSVPRSEKTVMPFSVPAHIFPSRSVSRVRTMSLLSVPCRSLKRSAVPAASTRKSPEPSVAAHNRRASSSASALTAWCDPGSGMRTHSPPSPVRHKLPPLSPNQTVPSARQITAVIAGNPSDGGATTVQVFCDGSIRFSPLPVPTHSAPSAVSSMQSTSSDERRQGPSSLAA